MPTKDKPLDQDEADQRAIEPLDQRIEAIKLEGGGRLVASGVAELLDCWKHLPKRYDDATEGQQQDVFRRFETLMRTLVQQVAEEIAAGGESSVKCLVGKTSIDSDIKVDLKLAPVSSEERDASILFLAHARGRHVVLRMASKDDYEAEQAQDPSRPDQEPLGFEAGSDTIEPEGSESESEVEAERQSEEA